MTKETKITINNENLETHLSINLTHLAPITMNSEHWEYIQDEAYKYKDNVHGIEGRTPEEIVNKLYYELHKLPGDFVLRLIGETFGLDLEEPEIVFEIYRRILKMRIK